MQKYKMQHLHSREAATGYRTYENCRLRRLVLNPLSEHTVRPYRSHRSSHKLCLCREMFVPPSSAGVQVLDVVSVALKEGKLARKT